MHLDALLVGTSRSLMLLLVKLVRGGAESPRGAARDRVVGSMSLDLLLVGLLGSGSTGALNSLRDVVGSVLDGVADLANDALVWLVNVWCRHVDCVWDLVG